MSEIRKVIAIVDVSDSVASGLETGIEAYFRRLGISIRIYAFDFRKKKERETSPAEHTDSCTVITRRELGFFGNPKTKLVRDALCETSDLFLSLAGNDGFPVKFMSQCTKSRFKIGRMAYRGHPFNMVIADGPEEISADGILGILKNYLESIK